MTEQTQTRTPGLNLMMVGVLLAVIAAVLMAGSAAGPGATTGPSPVMVGAGLLGLLLAVAGAIRYGRSRR